MSPERADHRLRRLVAVDHSLRKVVQLHPLATRGIPQQREGAFHVQAEALAQDPFRLFDADARAQSVLKLLCALAPILLAR
jgi:hypothetical protein